MKGLGIPKVGETKKKKSKTTADLKLVAWSKFEGMQILREIILFDRPLDLTDDSTWEDIAALGVRNVFEP